MNNIFTFTDVNKAWDIWLKEYLSIVNKHAPYRIVKVKKRLNPWFTYEIQEAIYRRDFLHRQAIRHKYPILVRKYKESKYHVKKLTVKTKRRQYKMAVLD